MSDPAPASRFYQLHDVARRLLELDVSDPDLRNKIVALKGRVTRAMNTPVGNPRIEEARAAAILARQTKAKEFSESVKHHIRAAQAAGRTGYSDIARYLNDKGVKTSRGSKWMPASVMRVMSEPDTDQ